MNGSSSSMMTFQKRIYTVLPRVRSNSASRSLHSNNTLPLSFFDSPPPPPPSSRPLLSTNRLPIESKGQGEGSQHPHSHPPLSLALTAPTSNNSFTVSQSPQYSLFPYSAFITSSPHPTPTPSSQPRQKRQKSRYQLDVGAYGIPKRCKSNIVAGREGQARRTLPRPVDETNLAVQVGEDAYFVRDNAMGVADGVGGWAKAKNAEALQARLPTTPSALFARRLMHFCSAELESSSHPQPNSHPPLTRTPLRQSSFSPFPHPVARKPNPSPILSASASPWYWSDSSQTPSEIQEDLESSLEELEDGIDVLMILERAYERTLKAHVVEAPSPQKPPTLSSPQSVPIPSVSFASSKYPTPPPSPVSTPNTIPLLAGSSTALLAVLDHVPRNSSAEGSNTVLPREYDAVIKIAHIGDCMGMLVRGEEIAWRSEEMWWNFNTPVQLGPCAPTSPSTSAHLFTLPVQADDILILASDGLSDNLWDEDVLEEVVRFRRNFLGSYIVPSSGDCTAEQLLRRRTLAGMLSEALCSRARNVSERKAARKDNEDDEVPFARRARELGKEFRGGKSDDISVIVAVISPSGDLTQSARNPPLL